MISCDGYCRICLVNLPAGASNIFYNQYQFNIPQIILNLCKFEVKAEETHLPQQICPECISKFEEVYKLQLLCHESNNKLRGIQYVIVTSQPEIINEEEPQAQCGVVENNLFCYNDIQLQEEKNEGELESDSDDDTESSDDTTSSSSSSESSSSDEHSFLKPVNSKHPCSLCEKQFVHKANLKQHIQNHLITGCKECDLDFESLDEMKTHMQMHQGGKKRRKNNVYWGDEEPFLSKKKTRKTLKGRVYDTNSYKLGMQAAREDPRNIAWARQLKEGRYVKKAVHAEYLKSTAVDQPIFKSVRSLGMFLKKYVNISQSGRYDWNVTSYK